MDLLKALSEISFWNEEFYSDDKLSIERRLSRFKNELDFMTIELEITERGFFSYSNFYIRSRGEG